MSELNIADILTSTARKSPEKAAVIWQDQVLPFDVFDRKVSKIARYLNRQGVGTGDRIGICLPNHANSLALGLGVMRAGATAIPLDFRLRPRALTELIEIFDIASVLVEPRGSANSEKLTVATESWWQDVENTEPGDAPFPPPADLAAILLTSGTTGKPMGTGRSHQEMVTRTGQNREYRPNGADDIYLNALPLSFSAGFIVSIGALMQGATTVMMPSIFAVEQMIEAIERHGVTSTLLVPTTLRTLLSLAPHDRPLFPDLGFLGCGGAPLSREQKIESYHRLSPGFSEVYASSLGGIISILRGQDVLDHPDSVGRLLPNVTLEIVEEGNEPVPRGEIGIIRLKAVGIAPALIGERTVAAATGDKIVDEWIYTGDLGRFDEDGLLYLEGRTGDMMLIGGVNVFPQEIVDVLVTHPKVRDAAVISRPSDLLGDEPVAFAVVDGAIAPQDLISHCVAALPPYKVPRQIVFVDALPYNPHGKTDTGRLRSLLP